MALNRRNLLQSTLASTLLGAVGQQAWAQAQIESLKIVTGFPPGARPIPFAVVSPKRWRRVMPRLHL